MPTTTPVVIEGSGLKEKAYDVFSRLMKDRIVFIGDPINRDVANTVNAQLLFLEQQAANKDIDIYINCPGGSVMSGLSIYDTMKHISCDISTICLGEASSMGAVLFAAGDKRYILPNARVMIHQPLGRSEGQAEDIKVRTEEMLHQRENIYKILSEETGQSFEQIKEDCDRDNFIHAEEAVEYGLADSVLKNDD